MSIEDDTTHNMTVRISSVLYKHDFIGLAKFGAPADEYDPEARMIRQRLMLEPTVEDLTETSHIISDTFVQMFSDRDMDHVTDAELITAAQEIQQVVTLSLAEQSAALAAKHQEAV